MPPQAALRVNWVGGARESSLYYDDEDKTLVASTRYERSACKMAGKSTLRRALTFIGRQLDRLTRLAVGRDGIDVELKGDAESGS